MERMEDMEIEEVQIIEEDEVEDEEETFVVEEILDSRVGKAGIEYFLKWHGFPETENSWEPVEYLNCPDLISKFEQKRSGRKEAKERRRRNRRGEPSSRSVEDSEDKCNKKAPTRKSRKMRMNPHDTINLEDFKTCGFERGLVPDKIIGVAEDVREGEVKFLMTWKGCDEADLISSRLVRARHPQLVIEFYEKMMAE